MEQAHARNVKQLESRLSELEKGNKVCGSCYAGGKSENLREQCHVFTNILFSSGIVFECGNGNWFCDLNLQILNSCQLDFLSFMLGLLQALKNKHSCKILKIIFDSNLIHL